MQQTPSPDRSYRFLLLGVAASSIYALSYVFVRRLGADEVHPFEIALFRNAFCAALLGGAILATGGRFSSKKLRPIMLRGAFSTAGILLWFYGLVQLPMAEAITLSMTTVCFATVGAAIFLDERISKFKVVAILLAIGGTMAIIRPTAGNLSVQAFAVLAAAACWGFAAVLVRSAARTEAALTIAFWSSAVMTVLNLPAAVAVWQTPTPVQFAELAAVGVLTSLGTLAWTSALRHGQTTQVLITDFVQLVWGVVIGLVAGEVLSGMTVLGIALIAVATALVALDRSQKPGNAPPGVSRDRGPRV